MNTAASTEMKRGDQGTALIQGATAVEEIVDVEIGQIPLLTYICSPIICWIAPTCCYQLETRSEAAIFHLGVLTGLEKEPGCHFVMPFGMEVKKVGTKQRTMDLPNQKVADGKGNPVMVSAILNYRIVDARRAILNVDSADQYLRVNAQAILKHVVSDYTYDELKEDTDMINGKMQQEMQPLVNVAGILVEKMALNDLSYAPEVASAMLKKQQASALIEARTLIVEGAVQIAKDAVTMLEKDGDQALQMSNEQKVHLVTNLLTVTCSETDTTPTLSM